MVLPPATKVWGFTRAELEAPAEEPKSHVYGLCFRKNGQPSRFHHAAHYVGIAMDGDVRRRVFEHLTGEGSPLVAAVVAAGYEVLLVLDVPGDRGLERRLHNQHGTPRRNATSAGGIRRGWCPLCNQTTEELANAG